MCVLTVPVAPPVAVAPPEPERPPGALVPPDDVVPPLPPVGPPPPLSCPQAAIHAAVRMIVPTDPMRSFMMRFPFGRPELLTAQIFTGARLMRLEMALVTTTPTPLPNLVRTA